MEVEGIAEAVAEAAGGAVSATIQGFFPEERGDRYPVLSERRNFVAIADEAHRRLSEFIDRFARPMREALPGASLVRFSGTPSEKTDANPPAVFGDSISAYHIQRRATDYL